MVLLFLLLPLLSFFILVFFGSHLGRNGVLLYSVLNMSITNLLSLFLFLLCFLNNNSIYIDLNNWFSFLSFDVSWSFSVDTLSVSMMFIISLISLLVHIYSVEYMYMDPNRSMFLGYLSLFTFFMILLVCSANVFVFFFSWEGVGICSYLLINFWNTRLLATQAAIKAILVNKISDLFLLVGLVKLSVFFCSSDIVLFELCIDYMVSSLSIFCFSESIVTYDVLEVCCILLFIGVVGKSSQLFLHTWLPDAMEGPTPVSALLHAATMVTAGVFLVIRFSFLFDINLYVLEISGILGSLTILVSGVIGLLQMDLKKVIAYSTCSQLGYMLIACSASVYYISLYHFTIHAFFKALLFLLSGCLIHSLNNEQDMRKYGGFLVSFPVCGLLFFVGNSALIAEPFLSGYYSKELVLFSLNDVYLGIYNFIYWLAIYGALLTILYSIRSFILVFFSNFRGNFYYITQFGRLSYLFVYPLVLLGVFSVIGGYFYSAFYTNGSFFSSMYISTQHVLFNHYFYDFSFMEHIYLLYIGNFLLFVLFLFYSCFNMLLGRYSVFKSFLLNRWYFDFIYNRIFVLSSLLSSENVFYKYLDKGFIELIGPFGIYKGIFYLSRNVTSLKNYTLFSDLLYIIGFFILSFFIIVCNYYNLVI